MSQSQYPTLPHHPEQATGPWATGRLGRYERIRELARGGMGVVLEGYDPDADREVAIKVVAPGLEGVESIRERFAAEARMTARLEHPGIVPVYEVGVLEGDQPFFAMKLVRGSPLTARLADHSAVHGGAQRRSLFELLEVLRKVCDALAYAHDQGAVHRDLKPDNILLGPFGEVYVCDWGLVHASTASEGPTAGNSRARTADPSLTLDGEILGTPGYMSPEQARGHRQAIGAATDVYALGAILYHVLTGVPPHAGETISAMVNQAARGELVPPSARAPDRTIPRELEAACLRAMATDPARRYADAAGLRQDLEAFLAGRELIAVRYSVGERATRWARRHPLVLAIACCAALGWGALAHQRRRDRDLAVGRLASEASELFARATQPGVADPAARQRALEDLVAASSALDHARRLDPDSLVLARQRRAAGTALGALALAGNELGLARQAYRELIHHGASVEEVAQLEDEVARASDRQLDRAREILSDVRAGLDRPGRAPDAPRADDHLFELASARDPRVARALGTALADALDGTAPRELGTLAARALGRLGRGGVEGSVAALAAALTRQSVSVTTVGDPDPDALWVEAGLALCATRDPTAFVPLSDLMLVLGPNSRAWKSIAPFTRHVPPPKDALVTEVDHTQGRVLLYLAQGREVEAMASLDACLAADAPPAARAGHYVNRALVWIARGEPARARDDLDRAILILDVPSPLPHVAAALAVALGNRAAAAVQLNDEAQALLDLERAIALAPSAEHYASLAAVRHREGRSEDALAALDRAITLAPERPETHINRARVLYSMGGRLADARAAIDRAIALAPRASLPLVFRATLKATAGSADEATLDLDRAVDLATNSEELAGALSARARMHMNAQRHEAAATDLERGRAASPQDHTIRELAAVLDLRSGRIEAARATIQRLVAEGASGAPFLLLVAHLALLDKDPERARQAVDRALEAAPAMAEGYDLRARASSALGDAAQAERDQAKAIELDPTPARLQERATLRHRAGRFAEARADLDQVLASSRDPAMRIQALLHRCQLDVLLADPQSARTDLARAKTLAPDDPRLPLYEAQLALADGDLTSAVARLEAMGADLTPAMRLMRAQVYAGMGQHAAAIADLEVIVDTDDQVVRPAVRPLLAKVSIQARDLPRAAQALEAHLRAYPDDLETRVDRAQMRLSAGDAESAMSDLAYVLTRDAGHPLALAARGGIYRHRGELAQALADHEASLVRGASLWVVQVNYGVSLARAGRFAEARAALTRAHELAPIASRPMIDQWLAQLPK